MEPGKGGYPAPVDKSPPSAFQGYTQPKCHYTLQSVCRRCLGPDAAALRRVGQLELQGRPQQRIIPWRTS